MFGMGGRCCSEQQKQIQIMKIALLRKIWLAYFLGLTAVAINLSVIHWHEIQSVSVWKLLLLYGSCALIAGLVFTLRYMVSGKKILDQAWPIILTFSVFGPMTLMALIAGITEEELKKLELKKAKMH
jgi:hypothetical protein